MIYFCLLVILIAILGGIVSGMFGGGSGIIYVPGFFSVLCYYYPDNNSLMQISMSTCFAASIFIGIFASLKQIKYGHVQLALLKSRVIYIIPGAMTGVYFMTLISSKSLKILFTIFLFLIAFWMIKRLCFSKKVKITNRNNNPILLFFAGLSTILSGVSAFFVPLFIYFGLNIKNAIGISTVITMILSTVMCLVTICFGLNIDNLPPYNLGYLNLGIFALSIIPSTIGAILGSKVTYFLPAKLLQYIYIMMIIVVAVLMAIK